MEWLTNNEIVEWIPKTVLLIMLAGLMYLVFKLGDFVVRRGAAILLGQSEAVTKIGEVLAELTVAVKLLQKREEYQEKWNDKMELRVEKLEPKKK